MKASRISATEFIKLGHHTNLPPATIVDLRTKAEVGREHMKNCINLPIQQLTIDSFNQRVKSCMGDADQRVFLLCQSGMRAEAAVRKLGELNGVEWVIVDGGLNGVKAAGGQIKQGQRKTIPLERQVRVTAGVAIIAGITLGLNLHPAYLYLSGFVGAGLIFAGITNRCGLAFLLARMPWNQ